MYLLYYKNPRTGKWHLFKNSHTGSLSGTKRYGRPSRSMRWGDVARSWKKTLEDRGLKTKLIKA